MTVVNRIIGICLWFLTSILGVFRCQFCLIYRMASGKLHLLPLNITKNVFSKLVNEVFLHFSCFRAMGCLFIYLVFLRWRHLRLQVQTRNWDQTWSCGYVTNIIKYLGRLSSWLLNGMPESVLFVPCPRQSCRGRSRWVGFARVRRWFGKGNSKPKYGHFWYLC